MKSKIFWFTERSHSRVIKHIHINISMNINVDTNMNMKIKVDILYNNLLDLEY